MAVRGPSPKNDAARTRRTDPVHDWIDVADKPFRGPWPVRLPNTRAIMRPDGTEMTVRFQSATREWWKSIRAMPHCVLWSGPDWFVALQAAYLYDDGLRSKTSATTALMQLDRKLGFTPDGRRGLRIRYVDPATVANDSSSSSGSTSTKGSSGKVVDLDERKARRRRVNSAS